MIMNTIQYISAHQLVIGDNVRKTFDTQKLLDLTGSILEFGVRRNLEVIALPDGTNRIVSGERRWRATMEILADPTVEESIKAEREMLPCLVLTEAEVPKYKVLNLIENLLRDDVKPSEEAAGFASLLSQVNSDTGKHWTMEEIASAVKQKPSYVRGRLQLQRAPQPLLEAVDAGRVAASVAVLVGRIPSPEQREVAAKMVLHPGNQEVPLDFEQTREIIRTRFMRSLRSCGFNPKDGELVPELHDESGARQHGGSCETCPHRSGVALEAEELSGGVKDGEGGRKGGIDPNLCTRTECFLMKQDATWKAVREQAERRGQKCLDGDAAKNAFSGEKGALPRDSRYVDLNEKPGSDLAGEAAKGMPIWSEVLDEADAKNVPVTLVRHPLTGRVHYLIARGDAAQALEAAYGAEEEPPPAERAAKDSQAGADEAEPVRDALKEQRKQEAAEKALKREIVVDAYDELFAAIKARRGGDEADALLAIELALDAAADACRLLATWLKVEVKSAASWRDYVAPIVVELRKRELPRGELDALLLVVIAAQGTDYHFAKASALERMAGAFKVDLAEIDRRVRKAHQIASKAEPRVPRGIALGLGADEAEMESERRAAATPNLRDWKDHQDKVAPKKAGAKAKPQRKVKAAERVAKWSSERKENHER